MNEIIRVITQTKKKGSPITNPTFRYSPILLVLSFLSHILFFTIPMPKVFKNKSNYICKSTQKRVFITPQRLNSPYPASLPPYSTCHWEKQEVHPHAN